VIAIAAIGSSAVTPMPGIGSSAVIAIAEKVCESRPASD
jgi:hypothetical protein